MTDETHVEPTEAQPEPTASESQQETNTGVQIPPQYVELKLGRAETQTILDGLAKLPLEQSLELFLGIRGFANAKLGGGFR